MSADRKGIPTPESPGRFRREDVARLQSLFQPYLDVGPHYRFLPYLMSPMAPSYSSERINTDEHGFRHCFHEGRRVTYAEFLARKASTGLVTGGSVVFGTGATADNRTLNAALQGQRPGTLFWNGGVGACNGFVEILMYLLVGRRVDHLVTLSGANDLLLHLGSVRRSTPLLPFPFDKENGFADWSGAPAGEEDRVAGFQEIAEALGPDPTASDIDHLCALPLVREGYARCLAAIERQMEIWSRIAPESFLFVLNPILPLAKTPTTAEQSYFEIALARMPPNSRCQRLVIGRLYPDFRRDAALLAAKHGLAYLDGNDASFRDDTCFIDDFHMTDAGYEDLAAAIAARLAPK